MRRIQMIICLLFFFLFGKGQNTTTYTSTRNYRAEKTYIDATTQTGSNARSVNDITYSDGFGRKWQEILVSGNPSGNSDLVIPHEYSSLGQVEKEYLPYVKGGNNGAFDANMLASSNWNVYGAEEQSYAFTRIQYEKNPLGRVTQQTGPGKAWHTNAKSANISYGVNQNQEVRLYKTSTNGTLSLNGHYPIGTLQKTTATDEDGHKTETFTDNNDKTVVTVAFDGGERMETYYVYDDRNQLRYVLPPQASSQLTTTTINTSVLEKLAYYYEYDQLDRMIVKRLPGCKPIYMVYDWKDRLVLSQDGKQRVANAKKWSYFVYDEQDREIESGEITTTNASTHQQLQQEAWKKEKYLPVGTKTPLQYTVYDNYKTTGNVTAHPFTAVSGYSQSYYQSVSGLTTSTKVRVLGTEEWVTTTTYYDDQCQPVQTVSNHPQRGLSYVNTMYDFVGNPLKQREAIGTVVCETAYTYDNRGRMLTKEYKWNGTVTDKISYEYDAIGRMTAQKYGERARETFSYNIRGWMTGIQSPYFSQTLRYTDGTGTPCFNGNISSMTWKAGSETTARGYKFTYDGVSRLKNAVYGEGDNLSLNVNRFNEQVTGYDKQGNILGLSRYGQTTATAYGLIDNLVLSYNGNQLKAVKDNATSAVYGNGVEFKDGANAETEYTYDENGNLTKDLNKKITTIQYNCLNLLEKVQFEDGNSIAYLYAADGTKLRTTRIIAGNTTTTDYCNSAVYENGVLVKVLTEDGYITAKDAKPHYFIQDHQGNNRVVVDKDGKVEETNHYYPFGGVFTTYASVQPYKYNGKELDRTKGLDWYDYGARQYDAAIGRWHTVDPMGEKYYCFSSYDYCGNNPVNNTDPNGMDWYQNQYGSVTWKAGSAAIDGYKNIGATFASPMAGGGFVNYYQNRIIYFSGSPIDIFATIQSDLRMQRYLLSRNSPLDAFDQSRLFNSINSRDIDAVLRPLEEEAVKFVASSFAWAGVGRAAFWSIGKIGASGGFNWISKIFQTNKAVKQTRVFWSGGDEAMNAAMEYASSNGMTTLNMTRAGKNLTNLVQDASPAEYAKMWQRLSAAYAKGAKGTAHVFLDAKGAADNSVWNTIEYPILKQNNIKIIKH
ncbi:DUF6443 domain-containing protein [Bacteroides sp.]|uniref:DUF6443 domain-containing protein n=1 Tax=Bacteroides sp. TaxID=29523 RepID=UPI002621473D|nr:DUF6443 domain-containing protein [Bacteroides sp.]MDD3036495.1 DUF6443 domain-containing protein [Bacteroides sp.]